MQEVRDGKAMKLHIGGTLVACAVCELQKGYRACTGSCRPCYTRCSGKTCRSPADAVAAHHD